MAYETELANMVHQTDVVAGIAAEAFTTVDSIWPLIQSQQFPDVTNVILFPKLGTIEAAAGTQSTALTYAATHEVTGTRKETAVKMTLEQLRFGGPYNTMERAIQQAVGAFSRLAASELKTLFSSISGGVTATTVLEKDNLLDARYTVRSTVKSASRSSKLVGYFDYKGLKELSKELTDTSASAFAQQVNLGVIGDAKSGTPKGELFDIVLFETDGLPTSGGDDVACIWDPSLCFCAGVDGINGFKYEITRPTSQTPWFELYAYTFWNIKEWHDGAGVKVLSDT
jgi:hypothetical protein